jgi:hypothetical protein
LNTGKATLNKNKNCFFGNAILCIYFFVWQRPIDLW